MISVPSSHTLLFILASRFEAGGGRVFHGHFGREVKLSSCARFSCSYLTRLNLLPPVFPQIGTLFCRYITHLSVGRWDPGGRPLLNRLNESGAAVSRFKSCFHDSLSPVSTSYSTFRSDLLYPNKSLSLRKIRQMWPE